MSKLSVKHFELLTQGTHVSWNYTVKQKCTKCVFYFYGKVKEERITITQFSLIETKRFFFQKGQVLNMSGFCTGSLCSTQGTPWQQEAFREIEWTVGCKTTQI